MSDEGFEDRRKAGEARVAQRNAEELGSALEGPGSEARLQELRGRFKGLNSGSRAKEPGTTTLIVIGFIVFLTILFFGVGRTVVEKMANEVNAQSQ